MVYKIGNKETEGKVIGNCFSCVMVVVIHDYMAVNNNNFCNYMIIVCIVLGDIRWVVYKVGIYLFQDIVGKDIKGLID